MYGGSRRSLLADADSLMPPGAATPGEDFLQTLGEGAAWMFDGGSPAPQGGLVIPENFQIARAQSDQPNFGPFPAGNHTESLYTPSNQQQIDATYCTRIVPGTREDPVTGAQFFPTNSCSHINPFFSRGNRQAMLVMFGADVVLQSARCAISSAINSGYTAFVLRQPMPLWFYTNAQYIADICNQAEMSAPSVIFVTDDPILTLSAASGKVPPNLSYYKGDPVFDGAAMRELARQITRKARDMRNGAAENQRVKLVVTTSAGPDMFNRTLLSLATQHACIAMYSIFIRQREVMRGMVTSFFHLHHHLTFPQNSDSKEDVDQLWDTLWECAYNTTVDWFAAFLRRAAELIKESNSEHGDNAAMLYTSQNMLKAVRTRRMMIRDGKIGPLSNRYTLLHGFQSVNSTNTNCVRFFAELSRNDDRFPQSFQINEDQLIAPKPATTALPFPPKNTTASMTALPSQSSIPQPPSRKSSSLALISSSTNLRQPIPMPMPSPVETAKEADPSNELEEGEMTEGDIERAKSLEHDEAQKKRAQERLARQKNGEKLRLSQSADLELDMMIREHDSLHLQAQKPQFSSQRLRLLSTYDVRVRKLIEEGKCPVPDTEEQYLSVLKTIEEAEQRERADKQVGQPPLPIPEPAEDDHISPTSPRDIAPAPIPKEKEKEKEPEKEPVARETIKGLKKAIPTFLFQQSKKRKRTPSNKPASRGCGAMAQITAVVFEDVGPKESRAPDKSLEENKGPNKTCNPAKRRPRGLLGRRVLVNN